MTNQPREQIEADDDRLEIAYMYRLMERHPVQADGHTRKQRFRERLREETRELALEK